MRIKEITSQNRRDFYAIYECEHCGHTFKGSGYDDAHYHSRVVPNMVCSECGKKAKDTYRPLTTKYPEGKQV
jgi:DNA-directed RNA polymerase subunit M/transcription elongation factor TFIIS